MWDEEINKKIKDAADQYHPAYDDSAWNKMEQMLDEHLPGKKDKRRIIYLLPLLILFLGGGIFFVMLRKGPGYSSKISEKALEKSNIKKAPGNVARPGPVLPAGNVATVAGGKNDLSKERQNDLSKERPVNKRNRGTKISTKFSSQTYVGLVDNDSRPASGDLPANDRAKKNKSAPLSNEVTAKNNVAENNTHEPLNSAEKAANTETPSPVAAGNNSSGNNVNTSTTKDDKEIVKPKDVAKTDNPRKDANSTPKQKKAKKSFLQNFGIGISAGPDVSAVKLDNTGKITLTYGAGLNYSFTDKFTLHTGFYVAKKIYSVGEDEYHVPAGSIWNNYLESVGANCKVYEIPVTIRYNFGKTKNHSWFASAGLSSYLMKKESYIYYYKNPSGNTWHNPWTVDNKNKHYFSVADISGGYEYSITKRFSLAAEPYLKLPLSGIGAGKIKLNSAGVLFTLSVKPFLK